MSETRARYHTDGDTADTHIRGISTALIRELRKASIDRGCNLATLVNEALTEYIDRHSTQIEATQPTVHGLLTSIRGPNGE